MHEPGLAPEFQVSEWLNTEGPLTLAAFRGRVVVIHAFQMLCPGCVHRGIPQAERVAQLFSSDHVAVVGIHTVFEHHAAMMPVALKAFIHEFKLTFPVGVDLPGPDGPIPMTMAAYGMRGTPTMALVDRRGRLRKQQLGVEEDLQVGADIASLLAEPA